MHGVLWAAAAGVSFGLFQAVNRRGSRGVDNYVATFVLLVTSALVLGVITFLSQDLRVLRSAPPSALVWFALAGALHFFLGWTFLGLSQRRVGAARTGVVVGATPLFGTLIALGALGEVVRPTGLIGVVLVVVGILVLALSRIPAQSGGATGRMGLLFGFATAMCWGTSPIFIRWGLEQLPSPLIGVTVGMAACAASYGLVLLVLLLRGRPAGGTLTPTAARWIAVAGMLIAAGTAAQWIALELAPVAVVLALNQLAVPVVLLVAPFIIGGRTEALTIETGAGALLVLAGTLLIIFSRAGPV